MENKQIAIDHTENGVMFISTRLAALYPRDSYVIAKKGELVYMMPDGELILSDKTMDRGQVVTNETVLNFVPNGVNVVAIEDIPEGMMPDGKGGFKNIDLAPQTQTMSWTQPSNGEEHVIPLSSEDIEKASTRMTATFFADGRLTQSFTFSNGVSVNFRLRDWKDLAKKVHKLLNGD